MVFPRRRHDPSAPCAGTSPRKSEGRKEEWRTAHVYALGPGASTQVSLVPPPWLELTTSEPSFSATRVSPPGMMVILRPDRTNGRRSTWRGATPWPTKVGQVDSARVGWAT